MADIDYQKICLLATHVKDMKSKKTNQILFPFGFWNIEI